MRIPAGELVAGDAIHLNDWTLHVAVVHRGPCTAVYTAEFPFILHFGSGDLLDIVRAVHPHGAAA